MNCNGIKFSALEFQMYMDNCIMRDSKTGKIIVIQKPTTEGLISFLREIRKAN